MRGFASRAGNNAEDPYKVLGVARDASAEDIKQAYRRLALKWHPDRNPNDKAKAEAEFKRVSKAYSVLSDPTQRSAYDLFGSQEAAAASGTPGRPGTGQTRPFTEQEAEQIFRQMFGNKPIQDIIREFEAAFKEQESQMSHVERQLMEEADKLEAEARALQMGMAQESRLWRRSQMMALATVRLREAQRVRQKLQVTQLQHFQERIHVRQAVSQLRRLDPTVQAQNRVRLGLSWGVALGSYFIVGTSLLQSVLLFIATSWGARLAFLLLRDRRQ